MVCRINVDVFALVNIVLYRYTSFVALERILVSQAVYTKIIGVIQITVQEGLTNSIAFGTNSHGTS